MAKTFSSASVNKELSSSKNKIKGALAASLTAFKKDLSLDIKLTIKHGQDLLDQGLDGVVFFGTTGEGNSINIQEKKQFIDTLVNEKFENERFELEYDIDGLVYKIDNLELQKRLGFTSNAPRWAIAHKFSANSAYSQILKIEIQIGRTGALTPLSLIHI